MGAKWEQLHVFPLPREHCRPDTIELGLKRGVEDECECRLDGKEPDSSDGDDLGRWDWRPTEQPAVGDLVAGFERGWRIARGRSPEEVLGI